MEATVDVIQKEENTLKVKQTNDLGDIYEVNFGKNDGDREDENISSENLLVEENLSPVFNKVEPHASGFTMGYQPSPYSGTYGGTGGVPVSMAYEIASPQFFCRNGDLLMTLPPAQCGISPYQFGPMAMDLTMPTIYTFPASQCAYQMPSPDIPQTPPWQKPSAYSAASSFISLYPSALPIYTTLPSDFSFQFVPSLLPSVSISPQYVLNSHPVIVTQESGQDSSNLKSGRATDEENSPNVQANDCEDNSDQKNKPHVKKPLTPYLLYKKEMRAKVTAECTLKGQGAITRILKRMWRELTQEERSEYYEKARQKCQLHMELYPGCSKRDKYNSLSKKKRKNIQKCRARSQQVQQNQSCHPCRREVECIRSMEADADHNNDIGNQMNDNLGLVDDSNTPEHDSEFLNESLSSPGCLSGLPSLQILSPSMANPLNLLTSPSTPDVVHNPNAMCFGTYSSASNSVPTINFAGEQNHQSSHDVLAYIIL